MTVFMAPALEATPWGSRARRPGPRRLAGRLPAFSAGLTSGLAVLLLAGITHGQGTKAQPVIQSSGPPQAEQAIRASYRCLGHFDAVDLTALFFNRAPAELVLLEGETATRLPQQRAADGALYASGNQSFRLRGDNATWQPARGISLRCSTQPSRP